MNWLSEPRIEKLTKGKLDKKACGIYVYEDRNKDISPCLLRFCAKKFSPKK